MTPFLGSASCLAILAAACTSGRAAAPPTRAAAPSPAAEAAAPPAPAGNRDEIIIGERLALRSEILGEDRVLLVYRPPPDGGTTRYPVIYLLDGDAHFHHVTGLVQFLVAQGRMPRAIVVGLTNTDRARDFTPTRVQQRPTSGGADRFLEFIERELIPAVEARYTTARYRVLIGHSLGGLLAVHALNRAPDLFDAAISISPSLAWGDRMAQRGTEALLAARPALDKALYVTVGNEGPEMVGSSRAYAEMLRSRAPRGLRWRFEEMAQEDHGSIVHRGAYRGLEVVFEGWSAPANATSLAELERHYQALSARFRIPVSVPEGQINLFGYRLMAGGKLDEAITVFRRNTALYPDSANAYDSLAEALEKKGDMAEAVRNYELAVRHAARNRDPGLDLYIGRLAAARNRSAARKK
jgi:hypothetical protein